MYNPKSLKAEEFICHEEVEATLKYADEHKDDTELIGKILFVSLLGPRFQYLAGVFCEPVIWCFMAAYLVLVYLHDPFVFPKKTE